jgi:cellulose synthase operon protein YhjQ
MQVIAFVSGKGGVGKTTLTTNAAVALAQRKKRVLLIDLDPQNALRLHLGMDPDDIAGLAREGIVLTSLFDSPFDVKFVPFGRVIDSDLGLFETELRLNPSWLHFALHSLPPKSFDFILLDTPPGPSVFLHQALNTAHQALLITLADAASYASIPKMMSLIKEYTATRSDFSGAHILINQMPTDGTLGHQVRTALYAQYAANMAPVAIHKDALVSQALAFERPVLQYEPGCKASLDIQYVADWLVASTAR